MYQVIFHAKIVDDLKHISPPLQKTIKKAIEEKLTTSPESFGKPLQFSLKGARSMRVGNYWVIFRLLKSIVQIIMIGHRSVVYEKIPRRRI